MVIWEWRVTIIQLVYQSSTKPSQQLQDPKTYGRCRIHLQDSVKRRNDTNTSKLIKWWNAYSHEFHQHVGHPLLIITYQENVLLSYSVTPVWGHHFQQWHTRQRSEVILSHIYIISLSKVDFGPGIDAASFQGEGWGHPMPNPEINSTDIMYSFQNVTSEILFHSIFQK
jgi:hypothetical protein